MAMMEDFGHFGDERLFGDFDPDLFADDFNVFEENQVFADREWDDDFDDEPDGYGAEDDGYEMGLGLE